MVIVSLVFAVVMIAVLGVIYQFGGGAIVLTAVVLGFLIFFGTFSAALLGSLLLLTLIGLVCRLAGAGTKKFVAWSAAATILTHAIVLLMVMQPMQEILELRREYPIESLRHRLAYEQRALDAIDDGGLAVASSQKSIVSPDAKHAAPQQATPEQVESLSRLEDRLDRTGWDDGRRSFRYRNQALERLYLAHESAVNEFMNSPGFGVGRMEVLGTPTRKHIDLPQPSSVPQPQAAPPSPLPSSDDGTPPLRVVDSTPRNEWPLEYTLAHLHMEGTANFADPLSFGYVRDLDHTIGFQPHAFNRLPQLSESNPEMKRWKIGKLELVSLLRHDEPQVYQSKNLPNMQELEAMPTRPLDDFESAALGKLRGGEDLVAATGSHEIRMLGSLRAAKQCLECHQVDRGTLLGAFTYRLYSDPPAELPKAEKPARKPAS